MTCTVNVSECFLPGNTKASAGDQICLHPNKKENSSSPLSLLVIYTRSSSLHFSVALLLFLLCFSTSTLCFSSSVLPGFSPRQLCICLNNTEHVRVFLGRLPHDLDWQGVERAMEESCGLEGKEQVYKALNGQLFNMDLDLQREAKRLIGLLTDKVRHPEQDSPTDQTRLRQQTHIIYHE